MISALNREWQVALHDLAGSSTSSPVRVYLHGLGASSAYFRDIVTCPAHRHARSLLIDLPGFGQSDAASSWSFSIEDHASVVAHILERLHLRNVDIVGHSMGGSIAIALAYSHPTSVGRLVLAEPALDPGGGVLSRHVARQSESQFVERGYARLLHQAKREAGRGGMGASLFLTTLSQASPTGLHRSAVSLLANRTPTFRSMLDAISIPRTLISGAQSELHLDTQDITGVNHVVLNDAGHVLMVDSPVGFARTVQQALT